MARFALEIHTEATPEQAWGRLWDLRRHTRFIPLTRVTGEPVREGSRFVGRTGFGPFGFDDPMVVTRFTPPTGGAPGRARIDKTGRVVEGHIDIEIRATTGGSVVGWTQEIRVAGVPAALDPVVGVAGAAGYRATVERIVRA